MIRPITTLKPPPPPRVDPKANAEQITRLQAEAAKLRNEIRLANKMGESDAAASARQRLTQVNAELTTAQSTSPAAQPVLPATQPGPVLPTAGAAAPQGNGTTTAFPALFTTQNFGGSSPKLVLAGYTPPDEGDPSPEVSTAKGIVKEIEGGKSIDNIAEERDMTPEQVVAALNAGGMEAKATEYANGDTRQVVITDGGRTITENQDYHHGGYYTEVTGNDGKTTSSPIRDDLGRKETTSVDPKTGAITTKLEDDLGDGSVTERTTNPQTRITTTTETNGDGAVTVTKNLPNGTTVKTMTPAGGPALPVTTVTGPDGKEVILAQTQTSDGSGAPSIQDQLAEGKSIEEIAEERGLTPEQVIAELNAAGLEVKQGGDPGETLQIVVTDPDTGKTVTYNNDYHHGTTSVTTVDGNTETTDSVDGNGRTSHTERNTETGEQTTTIVDPKNNTETTIVFDKDGRRTETIVETLNDGEPIDYEVKPGDNLSDIAEAYGVTLEELAESNPELFTSPRDPDLIHPGETVVIEGATKTTVNVTFNGYTLTTAPDGNMTLRNNGEGTELKFEPGSALEGLANLLMEVNPNSGDPEKAREGQTIKAAIEMVLYDENLTDLGATAEQKEKDTLAAIEQYGIGEPGEKAPGIAGPKPQGTAPSGGDWVQARGLWVDPNIARAMAAEDVAKSALIEIPAKIGQLSAQLDVYALDPAYKEAMKAADARLDGILAPYGLQWNPPEPKGTLADAKSRLTEKETRLKEASDAVTEYQEAVNLLDRAIRRQEYAAQFPDSTDYVVTAADSDYNFQDEVRKGDLARAEASTLFAEASAHTSKGDKLLADHQVGNLTTALNEAIDKHGGAVLEVPEGTLKDGEQPVEIEVAGTKIRVAPEVAEAYNNGDKNAIAASGKAVAIQIDGEWKWVHPEVAAATIELDAAKQQQSHAEKNLGVAEAYANVARTGEDVAEFEDLKSRLIEQYQRENPDLFKPDEEYSSAGGDYYGKITERTVIEKDGDLYLVLKFEHGDHVQEEQLTSIAGGEDDPESARNNPLNAEWRALWYGTDTQACGADGLSSKGGLEGLKRAQITAGEQAKNAEISRFDLGIEDIKTEITNLTEARDAAVTEHGAGTVKAPEGVLPPGTTPVKITVDGRELRVAPEVADAFNQGKPGALSDGVKAIQIEIDGQWKWVHPEVAAAEMELDAAEEEKKGLEENRQIAVTARDGYSFALTQPIKIAADQETAAKEEGRLQYTYLEEERDKALANYQFQFKSLYEQGYTEDFRQVEDLESEVTKIFDLDLTTEEGREARDKITEEVHDIAGDDASIRVVPMFFVDETTGPQKVVLLAVQDGDGTRYVDMKGGAYGNVGEFQDNNDIFGEEGKLIIPKEFSMKPGADGSIELDVIQPREFSTWDKIVDPIVGIGTGLATIASFTPLAPVAAPLAYAGGAYLATRAVIKQVDHLKYGGEWGEVQSLMNVATVATTALPMGSSLVRTAGLARTGMSSGKAFAGSLGISRSADDGFFSFGRYGQGLPSSQQLSTAMQAMRTSPGGLKWAAWTMDAGAMALGAPLLYVSAKDLVLHGNEMSGLELANAITGLGAGLTGTGLGLRGLRSTLPGKAGPTPGSELAPNSPVRVAPDGPQPRAVYEMGPDGVYRPTGEHVMPDPNEIIIDGDVVGETSGQQATGPRALPAGDSSGPNQPPPTGGRFDPSGDGQSSRPMVVHEQGSDGVHRPTDKVVYHDSSHPVVEGTVVNVHDDGATAPGERGDTESARDGSADGARELNARQPADSDPIVVPTAARDTGATSGNDNGGFGRLTWDPVTKSFTGIPEANTADYIYTSGKDPRTPSVYLDGVRPGDPMVKFTPEELLARYEQESRYYSGREMAERYGPNGLELPERSLQKMLPDIRVTGTFRLRVNTGAFGIGSPTTHAVAFGLGTKTDFGHLGWSVVDSISQKSTIPLRDAASSELMFTGRFREYLNVTGLQAGLSPFSHQTIFPVRGTKLLGMGENAIFKDAPGYTVKPRGARIAGQTPDDKGTVVDLTYSLNLDASPAKLAEGQRDFFGVTADNKAGFVRLDGPLPYDRVMAETKITPRVAVLANIPVVDRVVPRIGFEKRPEMGLKDTPGAGDVVSRQFFDLNQSMFDRVKLKVQFVINDANAAADFVAGVKNKDVDSIAAIREMMTKGQIEVLNSDGNVDRATLVSYVPNPLRSGLRLSAVAGKPASTEITLLTGEKRRVTHPDQSYLDLQLNDATSLPGVLAFNPDRFTTSLSYRLKSQLQKVLPERFQTRPPQARQMPTDGNVYRNFYGPGGDNPSTRYTVYFGTPNLRLGPIALSAEVRIQYKTKAAPIAPSVAGKETATLLFDRGGQSDTLTIPAWLARTVETAGNGSSAAIPKGGKASLESFLGELQKQARPDQAAAIEQFRNDFGTVIADGKFLRADAADGVLAFLATQARGDGPVTPRNAAPRQSPEEQGVKNTSSPISSSTKPLTEAEIAANRQEASRLLGEMVPQDLGMPEMTLADLSDQFSRSPTLMSLLRGAHAKGVRIVNPARQDLRIFDTSMQHDLTATGSQYDGPLKVISVDADMFRSPGAERGHDVVTGEFVDALAHELSHVTDPSSLPAPKDFQDRQAFVDAFVGANLNNEGRARFVQYAVAGELSANGGEPAPVLSAESNSADSAIYARYEAGEINRSQAINEMSSLFRDKEPSTVPGGTYQDFYTQQAEVMPLMSNPGNTRLPGKPGPANSGQPNPKNQQAQSPGINLTRNQLQAIAGNRVGQIDVSAFNQKQVPWLTRKQMGKLTIKQLQDLSEAGLHIYLTKPQIRAIPDTKIRYLNVAGLNAKQIPWLTDKHIENLTEQQFIDLNKAGLQVRFIKAQLQAVPDTRIELLDVKGLEGKQIPWLTRKQIAAMSDKQFQEFGDLGLLKYLTKAQLPEARIEALDVVKLDPKQVPWLTGDQVAALTREQWGAFTIHHIEALTHPQIEAATPKQFAELSPSQFRKFTLKQFEWMSMDQRNALSVLQLTTFRATHKKAMTPDQKAAVNAALSHARMRENAQAIATFGGMSSTSLALWSALPPHWSATASAVAFGARGVVFGTQALFPNATANHKPFGRFLNGLAGATFVAAAPGAAVGLIGGKDLIVNSSFTLGNIVYGTKSMLQSMTGRPVIRNIAEHLAGPGYVLGCAVYTVSSWPSPIATTAGTLFTFGCAEFWASAIRTDRLNRRSVPRTDEDIAKAEKSDARWTKADRWSLGITFGIGMLLFSLDSLLGEPWKPASDPAGSDPVKPGDDASDDDAATPPDDTPDTPPEKETPPEEFPQLVVVAGDGLNLREKPALDSEGIVVLEPGTFVEQTGKPSTETSGRVWIPIEGYGPDGEKETGWVAADFVKPHLEGASNPDGRTNPKLEESGYEWVEVRDGDSIRLIASTRSADVAETVVLNMDHILSPDVIFAGDRIYLPVTATG